MGKVVVKIIMVIWYLSVEFGVRGMLDGNWLVFYWVRYWCILLVWCIDIYF